MNTFGNFQLFVWFRADWVFKMWILEAVISNLFDNLQATIHGAPELSFALSYLLCKHLFLNQQLIRFYGSYHSISDSPFSPIQISYHINQPPDFHHWVCINPRRLAFGCLPIINYFVLNFKLFVTCFVIYDNLHCTMLFELLA